MNGAHVGLFLLSHCFANFDDCTFNELYQYWVFSFPFCCLWGVDDRTFCEFCRLLGLFSFCCYAGFM